MPRHRIALVFVVLMLALGSLMSATAANTDPIPPCWNTEDINDDVFTAGCAGVPINQSIGYVAVCTDVECDIVRICLYDENQPPGYEPLCGQV